MSEHTPKPWIAWFDRDENGCIYQAGVDTADRKANIAMTTFESVEVDDVATANRLIASDTYLISASPDLLEACKTLVDVAEDRTGDYLAVIALATKQAHAAINKATSSDVSNFEHLATRGP